MVGALSDDRVTVTGFGASADTLATVEAFRAMGVPIERSGEDGLVIEGVGMRGLREPSGPIDVHNARTNSKNAAYRAGSGGSPAGPNPCVANIASAA